MSSPFFFLLILAAFFAAIGLYAQMTANPKVVQDNTPIPQDTPSLHGTLQDVLKQAWTLLEDKSTNDHVSISYKGVSCTLSSDYYRKVPALLVTCSYGYSKRVMPEIVRNHEDKYSPGISTVVYKYPLKTERIGEMIQEILGVSMDKEQVDYFIMKM